MEGFSGLFPPALTKHVIVGLDPPDDAAVYRLDERRALIFTADYFPPVGDDPRAYGAIAATRPGWPASGPPLPAWRTCVGCGATGTLNLWRVEVIAGRQGSLDRH